MSIHFISTSLHRHLVTQFPINSVNLSFIYLSLTFYRYKRPLSACRLVSIQSITWSILFHFFHFRIFRPKFTKSLLYSNLIPLHVVYYASHISHLLWLHFKFDFLIMHWMRLQGAGFFFGSICILLLILGLALLHWNVIILPKCNFFVQKPPAAFFAIVTDHHHFCRPFSLPLPVRFQQLQMQNQSFCRQFGPPSAFSKFFLFLLFNLLKCTLAFAIRSVVKFT